MPEIHADMTITEVLEILPQAKDILFDYGIYSENSRVQSMETIREACESHGLSAEDVDGLIEKLLEL